MTDFLSYFLRFVKVRIKYIKFSRAKLLKLAIALDFTQKPIAGARAQSV